MPSFITPARVTAAIGVLAGLGATATSLSSLLPAPAAVKATAAGAGMLTAAGVLHKFLDGQSKWEVTRAAIAHAQSTDPVCAPGADFVSGPADPEGGVLRDEEPITEDQPEPDRLVAMAKAAADTTPEVQS